MRQKFMNECFDSFNCDSKTTTAQNEIYLRYRSYGRRVPRFPSAYSITMGSKRNCHGPIPNGKLAKQTAWVLAGRVASPQEF